MRKTVLWLFVVILTALVQSAWLGAIRLGGVVPNLPLLLVVYFAVRDGEERAMFTGLIGGVFQDVAADATLGHHVLCNVVVGYLAARVSHRLVTEHPAVKAGLVLMAGFCNGLLDTLILYIQNPGLSATHEMLYVEIPSTMYSTLVTPVVFFFLTLAFGRRAVHAGGLA